MIISNSDSARCSKRLIQHLYFLPRERKNLLRHYVEKVQQFSFTRQSVKNSTRKVSRVLKYVNEILKRHENFHVVDET